MILSFLDIDAVLLAYTSAKLLVNAASELATNLFRKENHIFKFPDICRCEFVDFIIDHFS